MPGYEDYFLSRISGPITGSLAGEGKLEAIQAARTDKIQRLTILKAEQEAAVQANSNSFVTKLGMDPSSVGGGLVNDAASFVSGATRAVGQVLSAPTSIQAMVQQANITDVEGQALARFEQGTHSPEDLVLINTPKPHTKTIMGVNGPITVADGSAPAMSPMERYQAMNSARNISDSIKGGADNSAFVHNDARQAFTQDLLAGYAAPAKQISGAKDTKDLVSGIAGLLLNAGQAVGSNKQAAFEYMLENIPQLFIGAAGKTGQVAMAGSNAGYALDTFNEGVSNYQSKNGGALPPEALRQTMARQAAQLMLAEQGGDVASLGLSKIGTKAADGTRASFKAALANTGQAGAKGLVTEAPTEGYQTYLEGEITGKPASGADIYAGAVIGGVSGAGLSGGGRAVHEAVALAAQPAAPKDVPAVDPTKAAVTDAAIKTGDVSAMTDPSKPSYAPDKAIRALFGNSQLATTTDEAKTANLSKADEIIAELELERDTYQSYLATPDQKRGEIAQLEKALAATEDGERVRNIKEAIAFIEEDLAKPAKSGADVAGITAKVKRLDRMLKEAESARGELSRLVQPKAMIDDLVSKADQADDTVSVDKVITLAMASPESVDAKQAAQLAANTSNALTEPQRAFLRTFSDARVAENQLMDMGGVSADIVVGIKNKGIAKYRAALGRALSMGNRKAADRQIAGLEKFEQDHSAKAAMAAEALDNGLGTQIVSDSKGGWYIPATPLDEVTLRKNGGLAINTLRLVEAIELEADALGKAVTEMKAAYSIKFTNGASNVQNVSQPQSGSQSKPEAAQERPAEKAGSTGNAPSPTAVPDKAGTGAPVAGPVEAARVTASQADYDEALRVKDSSDPAEYDNVPEKIAKLITAINDGVLIEITPEKTESTAVTEDPLGSTVTTESADSTEKLKSTAAEIQSTEKNTVDLAMKADELPTTTGELVTMAQKSPEGTLYKLRNLVADYFKQSSVNEDDSTQRPLVVVKDFLSQLSVNKALEFLKATKLSDPQRDLLKLFKRTAESWAPTIKTNLPKAGNPEFYFKDLMQFLVHGEGNARDLDENVKTAFSYAAFSWIVESASRPRFNSAEEINAILGRDENHAITEEEQEELGHVGVRLPVIANALGQKVLQALGMKATKDAKGNLQSQLEAAIGGHVLKLLLDQGIIVRNTVSGEQMARLTGDEKTNSNADHHFIKLDVDQDGEFHPKALEILTATRGTKGVLDKMFSVEPGLKEPSHEPIPFKQAKTKNTNQDVPSIAKPLLEKENAVASYVNPTMWQFASIVDEATLLEIAGAEHLEGKHAANQPKIEATNDALVREVTNFKNFVGEMMTDGVPDLSLPLYFDHIMWQPQRVGIATNMINPQTSKVHRHMMYRAAWETEIDINDEASMEGFLLRVGEGLGVKTDKQGNEASIAASVAKMDAVKDGVGALVRMLQNPDTTTMPAEDQKAVMAAVKTGGEAMHSLASLMALAQYRVADAKGETTFKVQLMGEVDGVTNGPMLSHLLLGAGDSVAGLFGLLNRGGFFEQGNEHSNYNLWREAAGHFDLYETTASHMTVAVQSYVNDGITSAKGKSLMSGGTVKLVMNAIYGFTGELADKDGNVQKAGRNIIKTPLTAMVFGSSVGKAVQSMADKFVSSIYAGIEDTAAGKKGSLSREQLIENLNVLLTQGGAPMIPTNTTIDKLMTTVFTPAQIDGLQKTFKLTLGKAVRQTMEEDFATFIEQRKEFNTAAQVAHEVYNAAYTAMYDQLLNEQMDMYAADEKTGIAFTTIKGVREPLHDLSSTELAEIRSRLSALTPIMHTAMSKDSNQLSAGLYIGKSERTLSTRSTYKNEIKFGTGIKGTKVWSKTLGKFVEQTGMGVTGFETVATSPGVSMSPVSTHSLDSAGMHYSQDDGTESLNVHDAKGVGVGGFTAAAQSLNKSIWTTLLNYSSPNEIYEALERTVLGFATLVADDKLPPAALTNLAAALKAMASKNEHGPEFNAGMLSELVANAKAMAFRADDMKLQALAVMQSVDQYALQGGQYEVTETDRAAAVAKRTELTEEVDAKTKEALEKIEAVLKKEITGEVTEHTADIEEDQTRARPATSPFGQLGKSSAQPETEVVAFFQKNPQATAKEVIAFLATILVNPFQRKLLHALYKVVDPALSISVVTAKTQEAGVLAKPDGDVLAWFAGSGSESAIYLKGTDFVNSGLRVETILHELVHAATMRAIHTGMSTTQPFVKELETLLTAARALAKAKGITKFDTNALSDIDELVAWGMTNRAFQTEILSVVQIKSTVLGKLTDGMQAFVATLARLIGIKDVDMNTGLGVLITNVAGLMEQTAAMKDAFDGPITRAMAAPSAAVDAYSTMDIFNAMDNGALDASFQADLRNLLGGIVERLHGPFGAFKAAMRKTEAGNPLAVWLKALETGKAPFASSILASGFTGNSQQDFVIEQVEATVRAALNSNEASTKETYRDLAALYQETYARLKPSDFLGGDWNTTTTAEAQSMYDFVFKLEKTNGDRSDYLARFAALGLAHQGFNKLLQVATKRDTGKDVRTFTERLQNIFEEILAFFNRKVTHTFKGQNADVKLTALVEHMVEIEAKRRHALARQAVGFVPFMEPIEAATRKAIATVTDKITDTLNSPKVKGSANAFVRASDSMARTVAGGRVDFFLEAMTAFRDSQFKGQLGVVAGLLNSVKGPVEKFKVLLLASKLNERVRKQQITFKAKFVLNSFINKGRDLSRGDKAAVTKVFLRTGMHTLLTQLSMAEIETILGSKTALDAEITKFEGKLDEFGAIKRDFILDANGLGHYKATGVNRSLELKLNATAIANRFGSAAPQLTEAQILRAEGVIASLVSLYALRYTEVQQLSAAKALLAKENARPADQGNGVEFALELHKHLEAESLARLFKGNEALMVHGYTPEIYNYRTLLVTANALEGKELENLGYSKGPIVPTDPADPDQADKHIYRLADGGLSPHLTGVIGYDGKRAKGSPLHSGYMNPNTLAGSSNQSASLAIQTHRTQLKARIAGLNPSRDLSKEKGSYMAPVFNEKGDLVNWRYLMTEATKDDLLERDNDFSTVLGTLAGSIQGKQSTVEQNKAAVEAMHEQYQAEYATRGASYVLVGPKSLTAELREMYALLPDETKQDIEDIWGREGMMVRSDSLDLMFGYRKLSLAQVFEKDPAARNELEKLFVKLMEWALMSHGRLAKGMSSVDAANYAKRAAVVVTRGERAWMELVSETKDLLVVKTGVTLMGNIFSNFSMLYLQGVSVSDMLAHTLTAFKGATAHREDSEELDRLRTELATGFTQGRDEQIRRRILVLEDAIARNPVTELIDAGLMPTIVEDIAAEDDIYSFKSMLTRKVESVTNKLNPTVVKAARAVYMSHDSKLYRGLSHITQLSDFVARYALYQHQTTRKVDPLSKKDAILRASDAFVNYDIPMHRGMQYSDDMGFTMFTKYFLYIQRELWRVSKENPARVYSMLLLNAFHDLGPIVLDSSLAHHFGNNPLRSGAMGFPGSLDKLMTVSTALAIVK